jgi:transposase InsO family protein
MRKLSREETVDLATRAASPGREVSIYGLARTYGVSDRWARELRRRFLEGRPLPGTARLGRPPTPVPEEERAFILECEDGERLNPVALERAIERHRGLHIPHNRIWRVLKEAGFVRDEPKKQKRRAWVRFERRFSNSLWQMDYTLLGPGRWLLVILDDASRLIVGYGLTRRPTAEFAWATFHGAGERYGYPRQLLTDHGTQFTKEPHEALGLFDRKLRDLERERGIRVAHIHGRVKHPQTGGKVERVNGTIKASLRRRWPDGGPVFRDADDVIAWYNTRKPHMSLDFEHAETPLEAFERKLRPREREGWRRRQ